MKKVTVSETRAREKHKPYKGETLKITEGKKYIFSMDAPECQVCQYYNDCKNKRRVSCIWLEPLTNPAAQQSTQPIATDVMVKHDYRNIKIGENTTVTIDLEEMKKKMVEDIYTAIGCPFMEGC